MKLHNYTQFDVRDAQFEDLDIDDLKSLDKTSITEVKDFILHYQADKTFAPPESSSMVYDSDISEIDVDKDVAPELSDDEFDSVFSTE